MEEKMKRNRDYLGNDKSRRYTEAFKRKVVSDIKQGFYTAHQALSIHKIGGKMTVYKWLAKYDTVRAITTGEPNMKKKDKQTRADLEARIHYLEKIVADLSSEKKILEATIDVAKDNYGLDLKKKPGNRSLEKSVEEIIKKSRSKK
jgi:transposase-like protein